jgi:hypothetical protein
VYELSACTSEYSFRRTASARSEAVAREFAMLVTRPLPTKKPRRRQRRA